MRFAREGYPIVSGATGITVLLFLAGWTNTGLLGLGATLGIVGFFRDPDRIVPPDPETIVAPADGRVIKVIEVCNDPFAGGPATVVSIFMSPLDVHVNRIPADGRVVDVCHTPGRFLRAYAGEAPLENERNAVLIEDPHGRRLGCVQIAGFLARRIVCRLRPGMAIRRGERYGMIMFGSRVDLHLPAAAEILIRAGQRARAGSTVVARWP